MGNFLVFSQIYIDNGNDISIKLNYGDQILIHVPEGTVKATYINTNGHTIEIEAKDDDNNLHHVLMELSHIEKIERKKWK